jgi:hypothetical protein
LLISWSASAQAAAPRGSQLLPNTTREFITVENVQLLEDSWNRTQFNQLLEDPALRPMADALREQFGGRWQTSETFGFAWPKLKAAASGEVCWAVLPSTGGNPASVLLLHVMDRRDAVSTLLKDVAETSKRRGAERSQRNLGAVEVTQYVFPASAKGPKRPPIIHCLKDDLLIFTDDLAVLQGILDHWDGKTKDTLDNLPAFQAVMKRCQSQGENKPQLCWFIEPLGRAELMRNALPKEQLKGLDPVKVLKNEGFDAIRGVGGVLYCDSGDYDLLYRAALYAPPPYTKSMRILLFPADAAPSPPSWVTGRLSSYTSFNWDLNTTFDAFGSFVEAITGQEPGTFKDVLDSLQNDPDGSHVDVRKNLVGQLKGRFILLRDYQTPIKPGSERFVLAAEVANEKVVAQEIGRFFEKDKNAKSRIVQGSPFWEVYPDSTSVAPGKDGAARREDPPSALAVAQGHLFVSTRVALLEELLAMKAKEQGLASQADYQRVVQAMDKLGADKTCLRLFVRLNEDIHPTYEILRTNKLDSGTASSLSGLLLNQMMPSGVTPMDGKAKIDWSMLPDFAVVERYLQPGGAFVTTQEDGWFMVGFVLKKAAP